MNRLILLLLFLFRALINFAQPENNCDTCFYDQYSLQVVIKNTAISTENKILQNSTLRQLLKEDTLIQCFPYSKNEYLKRVYRIKSKWSNASQLMNDLLNNAEVEHVERIPTNKNPQLSGFIPSDYFWGTNTSNPQGDLWHLKRTMAGKAWDITKGNPNIKIATIDGGFDISHPDLSGKFIYNYDPEDLSTFTNCSIVEHGTLQASFIAATTDGGGYLSGLGFNCKLIGFNATNNLGGSIGSAQFMEKAQYASLVLNAEILTK